MAEPPVTPERRRDRWGRHLWALLLLIGTFLEVRGLIRRNRDDTLSEYTWSKTGTPVLAGAVTALVGWLVYHLSFGNGVPLSHWDGIFAGGGAILGVVAAIVRGRRQQQ